MAERGSGDRGGPADVLHAVRATVATIPRGKVASYGDIAARLGLHPRQVGRAVSVVAGSVPWWRVVRADGTPASCHGGTAPELLRSEDVPMRARRVDLAVARHRWPADLTDSRRPDPSAT